ncbi:CD1375 family protein [Parablautia sp. Marseille-Q6255]|nr:CD1375 family protein [Parablautia sp. Marseille-Q6255]
MAKVYAELIRKELKTLEDVPDKLRADVRDILAGDNR